MGVQALFVIYPRTPIAICDPSYYFTFVLPKLLFSVCLLRIFADSMLIAVNDYRRESIGIQSGRLAGRSPNRSNASGSISLYIYRDYEKSQHTAIKTSDTSCVCLVVFRIFNNVVVSRLLTQWEHIHKLANVIGGRYSGFVVGELSSAERRRPSKTADPVSYERPGPRSAANQKLSICCSITPSTPQ